MRVTIALALSAFTGAMTTMPVSAQHRAPRFDPTGAQPLPHGPAADVLTSDADGGIAGAVPSWVALGPFGGDVQDVAVSPTDPNLMLAGTAPAGSTGGALYRSTNAGANWSIVSSLSTISVYDIEFAPDGTAYAATVDSVRKSTNGGTSWTTLNLNIGLNDQVFDLAIDPNNPNILWIGVADAIGNQPVNVMQSTDAGATWVNRTPPLASPMSGRAIAINPNNSQEIYAGFAGGFGGGQVWVSTNGGLAWVNRSAGLPNTPVNDIIHTGTRALVCGGQLFGSQNFGLFQTTNQGVNWSPLHDPSWPSLVLNDIAVDPNNANTIYTVSATAGVFRSVNGGPWTFGVGGTGSASMLSIRFAPGSSTWLVAGANSVGVLQSTNAGGSFSLTSNGIIALNIRSAAANPLNPNELAIAFEGANNGGVYTSLDGGQTWTPAPVPPTRYSHVKFSPTGVLHAISSGPSSIAPEGVYRRAGNGVWSNLGPDQGTLFESDLAVLEFSATDPNLILAGGADFGVAGFEPTIWRRANDASPWVKAYEGPQASEFVTDIKVVGGTGDQIMIASFVDNSGSGGGGALRSVNGGLGWSPSSTGLPASVQANALSATAIGANTFFLADRQFGVNGGLYRTDNGGQSWTGTGFMDQVIDVIADPQDPQAVYILQANATRVQKSTNAGASFQPFNTGLTFSGGVNRLAYQGGPNPRLLLCSSSAGTYATELEQPPLCPSDVAPPGGNGNVNVDDLLAVINGWGPCPAPPATCPADIVVNSVVNVDDLLAVINAWGVCD